MNSRFLPGKNKDAKPGLENVRKLVPISGGDSNRIRESIPSDWFYNENSTNEMWGELEAYVPKNMYQPEKEKDPFKLIDESATKIRNLLQSFEAEDEECLMRLMQIVGEDDDISDIDQASILFESRTRLEAVIAEHVDFVIRQSKLLEGIYYWFKLPRNSKIEETDKTYTEDSGKTLQQLQIAIDEMTRKKEGFGEEASLLHSDIVNTLSKRVNEYQRQIAQKDLQLSQMAQDTGRTKKKRQSIKSNNDAVYKEQFALQQRKIIQLQNQVKNLKDAVETFKQQDVDKEKATEIFKGLSREPTMSNIEFDLQFEKEVEYENKIKALESELKSMKSDNKQTREALIKAKQNEIINEKKMEFVERQKKSLEGQLNTLQNQMKQSEDNFKEKLEIELRKAELNNKGDSGESTIELTQKYEAKIASLVEKNRKQIQQINNANDVKMKEQLKQIQALVDSGDGQKVFEETCRILHDKIDLEKEDKEKQIKELKENNAKRFNELSMHYESILRKMSHENEAIKSSVESQVRNRLFELRLDIESQFNKRNMEEQTKLADEMKEKIVTFVTQIESLQQQLEVVKRERNSLKAILVESEIIDDNEEEEVQETKEDDVLQQSLMALKEREIEQKASEKYGIMLQKQKETLENIKAWEIEEARKNFETQFEERLSEFRSTTADEIQTIYDMLPHDDQIIEELFIKILSSVNKNTGTKNSVLNQPMIPVSEVESKVSELQAQIIELSSENDVYKAMIESLKGEPNTNSDFIDTTNKAMSEQKKMIGELSKQNLNLQNEVKSLSNQVSAAISRCESKNDLLDTPPKKLKVQNYNILTLEPNAKPKYVNQEPSFNTKCLYCHKIIGLESSKVKKHLTMASVVSCPNCSKRMILCGPYDEDEDDFGENEESEVVQNVKAEEDHEEQEIHETKAEEEEEIRTEEKSEEHSNVKETKEVKSGEKSSKEVKSEEKPEPQKTEKPVNKKSRRVSEASAKSTGRKEAAKESKTASGEKIKLSVDKSDASINIPVENVKPKEIIKEVVKVITKDSTTGESVRDKEIETLIEDNNLLKNKLIKTKGMLEELEGQYTKKVESMSAKIKEMKKQMLEKSIDIISSAKELPLTEEAKIPKIKASKSVASDIAEIHSQQKDSKIAEMKNKADSFDNETPLNVVQETLKEQAALLEKLKNQQQKNKEYFVPLIKNIHKTFSSLILDQAGFTSIFQTFVKKQKEAMTNARKETLNALKKASLANEEANKIIKKLNSVLDERDKSLQDFQTDMTQRDDENDKLNQINTQLHDEINKATSEIQRAKLERIKQQETIDAILSSDKVREDQVSALMDDVAAAKNEIRIAEKELNMQKLRTTQLENENFMLKNKLLNAGSVKKDVEPVQLEIVPSFVVFNTEATKSNGFALLSKIEANNKFSEQQQQQQPQVIYVAPKTDVSEAPLTNSPRVISERESQKQIVKQQKGQQIIIKRPSSSIRIANARPSSMKSKNSYSPKIIPQNQTRIHFDDKAHFTTIKPIVEAPLNTQRSAGNTQFDYLVPLTTDDNSSSIIAYVTRYMKIKGGQKYTETKKVPSVNVSPRKLISACDSGRPCTARKGIVVDSYVKPKTDEKALEIFANKTRHLETLLNEKTNEMEAIKDKTHDLSVQLYKTKQEVIQCIRQNRKNEVLTLSVKKELSAALELIVERDKQIQDLKNLIAQFRTITNAVKTRIKAEARSSRSHFASDLQRSICNVSKTYNFTQMAKNEIKSLERWEAKRSKMIEEERQKMIKILEASKFLQDKNTEMPLLLTTSRKPKSKQRRIVIESEVKM